MLRLLPTSLGASSASRTSKSPAPGSSRTADTPAVEIAIHVPNHGAVFMPIPDLSSATTITGVDGEGTGGDDEVNPDGTRPRTDYVMTGELEVFVLPSKVEPGSEEQSGSKSAAGSDSQLQSIVRAGSKLAISDEDRANTPTRNRRRCRAIRVGLKSVINLDLGPGRMGEEDELLHRKVEIRSANADGIWLDEGSQRFEFSLVLPATLAPHDWHSNGSISINLYAELEGIPLPSLAPAPHPRRAASPAPGLFGFGSRSQSRSRSGQASPTAAAARSRSSSPAPSTLPISVAHPPPLSSPSLSMSITRQEAPVLPATPSYAESQAAAAAAAGVEGGKGKGKDFGRPYELAANATDGTDDSWIQGTISTTRIVYPIYNPKPAGGVTELDDLRNGVAEGLGEWSARLMSDVWTICAFLRLTFQLPQPSPLLTLFNVRAILSQTHSIISPRDDPLTTKPLVNTRQFVVVEHGTRPPKSHVHPGKSVDALWRGTEAGGNDVDGWGCEGQGRLPNDDVARPTTFPGVITPIKVSHALIVEVYFSVWGEDERGNAMRMPGPGALRVLRSSRPVELPSCAYIPVNVNLPSYEDIQSPSSRPIDRQNPSDPKSPTAPCPKCHRPPSQQACTTCPPSAIPHARHDHPPHLVGNRSGVCPVCSRGVVPGGTPGWRNCACGAKIEEMEERMRRFVQAETEERRREAVAEAGSDKIWAERGRAR